MLIVSLIAAGLAAYLFIRTKAGPSDPPNSQMAAIRIRTDNRRDDLPISGPNWVILILVGLTLAAFVALALRTFPF